MQKIVLPDEQIRKDMLSFIDRVKKVRTRPDEEIMALNKEIDEYYAKYEIREDLNLLCESGYGEMLYMLLG